MESVTIVDGGIRQPEDRDAHGVDGDGNDGNDGDDDFGIRRLRLSNMGSSF